MSLYRALLPWRRNDLDSTMTTVPLAGHISIGGRRNGDANRVDQADRAAHEWYRFVLSFPPHLVRHYVERFALDTRSLVLDSFCGTGTTLVECRKLGIPSVGIEANPMAWFASSVKTDWAPDADSFVRECYAIADAARRTMADCGTPDIPSTLLGISEEPAPYLRTLPLEQHALLLKDSISPIPLHKALILRDTIEEIGTAPFRRHQQLAYAKALVGKISNLRFGPEVGVGPPKQNAAVVDAWLDQICLIGDDLRLLPRSGAVPTVIFGDARRLSEALEPCSVDAVITSPPYPNEKDYTRTTRLESVLLGFVSSKQTLRDMKQSLIRSNTRNVYKKDTDDTLVADHPEVRRIADAIEARRIEMGKTSGFERLYARVTQLYFGGMRRHLADLRTVLKPGAMLAYVVGDQASYLRIMIRTGAILSDIATNLGYDLVDTDLFRTRLATATRQQLREEVVILRWPG